MLKTFIAAAVLTILTGCVSQNPLAVAKSAEQKAYALYGSFVISEEVAAKLVTDPAIPEEVKRTVRAADRRAKPVADSLMDATQEVVLVRGQLSAGATTDEKLVIATVNLQSWYDKARQSILQFVCAVTGDKTCPQN